MFLNFQHISLSLPIKNIYKQDISITVQQSLSAKIAYGNRIFCPSLYIRIQIMLKHKPRDIDQKLKFDRRWIQH